MVYLKTELRKLNVTNNIPYSHVLYSQETFPVIAETVVVLTVETVVLLGVVFGLVLFAGGSVEVVQGDHKIFGSLDNFLHFSFTVIFKTFNLNSLLSCHGQTCLKSKHEHNKPVYYLNSLLLNTH